MPIFSASNILLPQSVSLPLWSVIACDQFTSQPEYWRRVRERVENAPSTLHLTLPEAELGADDEARAAAIARRMEEALRGGLFAAYPNAFVYVERTLQNGRVRRGLVGQIDLEAYDYGEGSTSPVRASERTVAERVPPRMRVRRDACLDLPHVLLLCDDERRALIEPLTRERDALPLLYDFDLMEGGGRIRGRLVSGERAAALAERIDAYERETRAHYADIGAPALYAVGDGNHSLAAAKACYEERKRALPPEDAAALPARYALVELVNIRDEAIAFEPIHRLVRTENPEALLSRMREALGGETGPRVSWFTAGGSGAFCLAPERGALPVGAVQGFLDDVAQEILLSLDYIHGEDALRELSAREGALGVALPAVDKAGFFRALALDGVLPRKAFSMGHAQEKRYYLEARALR